MGTMGAKHRWATALAVATVLGLAAPAHANGIPAPPGADRGDPVRGVDEALARLDVPAAERAWHEAYIAALSAWRWEGPIEVGDASLRIGERSGSRQAWAARARNLYLTALLRAQQQGSVDGVLRAAEAFAGLGDRAGVEQCLRIAERLASEGGAPEASARVRAAAGRLADERTATRAGRP